ncbi:MAG: glutaredoxin family protein [Pseudomonadales bacterium]|jgi:hypothetical protein|nr:glutaredoxin family protein [Pseudomonadales bacterium]MDP6471342.1 glutaredoxin family protein [Pseudomonadales bacterium]MDP6826467.1 glutaredoxin family protein [Pseudomonadales bacterium]MDP6970078.1 glutaredoxin family protein [Pseudomonadales bacterium]|tara:strand:- start:1652 stop:1882 length:231 start_codon:yes stop_codon:yes gene_type:complete
MILYSTDHCSLCEEALDLLLSMPELQGLALSVIDVAGSDRLTATYGERLPVLRAGLRELDWPFKSAEVAELIRASG